MMKKNFWILALGVMTLGMASCSDNDYFSLDDYQKLIKESFPVDNVDPNHTWATTASALATITVNGDYGENYTVALFLENPIGTTELTQLFKGDVESGNTLSVRVSYPVGTEQVYVGIYDKAGRRIILNAPIENGRISLTYDNGASTSSKAPTRATEAEEEQYAKTLDDYLNPAGTPEANRLTVEQMKKFEAFTNADIESDGYIFGWDNQKNKQSTKRKAGVNISTESFYYKVAVGFNPTDGQVEYIYKDSEPVAKIQFFGTGSAATANSNDEDFTACLSRPYIIVTPLVSSGNIYIHHNNTTYQHGIHVQNLTNNTLVTQWGAITYTDYCVGVSGGNKYKIYPENSNDKLEFIGIKYVAWGQTIDDPDAGTGTGSGSGGDNGGSGSGTGGDNGGSGSGSKYTRGDGQHFRVAAGTTVDKKFDIHWGGSLNDKVIYVEGKLKLDGNSLNSVTIVVGDGGEVVLNSDMELKSSYARFVVMDGGTISGASDVVLDVTNGGACYNAGTIDFEGTIILNGSGFYNCGTVNVDILTGTSDGTLFTNFGRITARTNSIQASAYNQKLVNGCYLHFTEDAGMGNIILLDNSRIDVNKELFITGSNQMYDKSVINAKSIYWQNGKMNGPTTAGQFAIVKSSVNKVSHGGDLESTGYTYFDIATDSISTYGGELYIKKYNANDYTHQAAHYILTNNIHYFVREATAPNSISIPKGDCTGVGYNPNGNNGSSINTGTPISFRFCFEDNFPEPGDYDFNDLVMTVKPELDDKTLTLTVTLDAVGAGEQLAAALRLVGLTDADLDLSGSSVQTRFTELNADQLTNIPYQNSIVSSGDQKNYSNNVVIAFFKDAHLAINPTTSNGLPQYLFYNTMKDTTNPKGTRVSKKTAVYKLKFQSAETARNYLNIEKYDLFLIENYNAQYWEVHTYAQKGATVFHEKPQTFDNMIRDKYVWALAFPMTATQKFQYPVEWQQIGSQQGSEASGAYLSFGSWVANQSTNTDWWHTPSSSALVYDESQLPN